MALLMHLSDLHFGAHDQAVCAAVARLAARLPVTLLVVSGDLTQRATAAQFAQAREFLDSLSVPRRLVVPGNHDLPLLAWWERLGGHAHDRYVRWIDSELQPWCAVPGFCVIGVDTTRWWRHQRGSLSAGQILHVAQRLEQASPADWRIVVSHHPLAAAHEEDRSHRPHRAAQALLAGAMPERNWCSRAMGMTPAWSSPCPGCGQRRRAPRSRCGCAPMRPTACSPWSIGMAPQARTGAGSSRAGTIRGRPVNSCPCKGMCWIPCPLPGLEIAQAVRGTCLCIAQSIAWHAQKATVDQVCMLSYVMEGGGCG